MKSSNDSMPAWLRDGADSSLLKMTMAELAYLTEADRARAMIQLTMWREQLRLELPTRSRSNS